MVQLALITIDFYFENWTLQFTYEGTQYRRQIAYFKMPLTTEANPFSRLASVVRGQTFQLFYKCIYLIPGTPIGNVGNSILL